jgi:hypothetical protein
MRMLHELDSWPCASFITLTYSDEYLPDDLSVHKEHLQKFFKRLRKAIYPSKIRYFACGEYGTKTQRPHYHAIVFGLSLCDYDRRLVKRCWKYCDWSVPAINQRAFGLAEVDSIRYVAQYIDKKFTGDLATAEYEDKGREPVFRLMSLGLGRQFLEKNREQLTELQAVPYNKTLMTLPRYYLDKLGIDTDYAKIKAYQKETEYVESVTGEIMSRDEFYLSHSADAVMKLEGGIKDENKQKDLNLESKLNLKHRSSI